MHMYSKIPRRTIGFLDWISSDQSDFLAAYAVGEDICLSHELCIHILHSGCILRQSKDAVYMWRKEPQFMLPSWDRSCRCMTSTQSPTLFHFQTDA